MLELLIAGHLLVAQGQIEPSPPILKASAQETVAAIGRAVVYRHRRLQAAIQYAEVPGYPAYFTAPATNAQTPASPQPAPAAK